MLINTIWAQDECGAIGKGGTLPWHIPEDLMDFKRLTAGCPVIMGRKTFESLPLGALPGRLNVVVSRVVEQECLSGATCARSLEEAIDVARASSASSAFVIGGSSVYSAALPYVHRAYVTAVGTRVHLPDAHAPVLPGLL